MRNDFERMNLRELVTDAQAFLAFGLGVIGGLTLIWLLMLWGYA